MAGIQTIASLLIKVGVDPSAVEAGMAKAEAMVTKHSKAIGAAQKIGGAAIAGGLAFAAKGAMEAEEAMARYQAETGASAEEARRFGDDVNAMAGATTIAYSQIAESATKVRTDLGLVGDEAEAITEKFVAYQRATAQGAESVLAFDDILDAWNLEATEAAGLMDVLVVSHQKYGGSVAANQKMLAELAPTLQAANMGWEEGQGLLNLFARAGVSGEAATTAFNRALTKVKSPEELRTMLETISKEPDAFKRATMAADLFGARAGTKLGQALQDANGDLGAFIVTQEDAAGASDKAAAALENTFGSKLTRMLNGAKAGLRGLGMEFGPLVTGAASLATLGQTLGVGKFLPAGLGKKITGTISGAVKAGWRIGMSGVTKFLGPAMDKLGEAMGGRFGKAFKAAGLLALGVMIAEGLAQLNEVRNANIASVAKIDADTAAFLERMPSRAEVEASLTGLKAIPGELDGIGQGIMAFGDLGRGNILGSAMDGLFGSNPAAVAHDKIAALEAYLATLPPDMEAAGENATTAVGAGMEAGAAKVPVGSIGKRLREAITGIAPKVASAWDVVTNALAKGPKIQGMNERMAEASKAVAYNARQLARAIRAGDSIAAAEYSTRLMDARKAKTQLKNTHEETMRVAGSVLGRHRAMARGKWKGMTRDMDREGRKAGRDAERNARKTANANPKALTTAEPKAAAAADAVATAVETPLVDLTTAAPGWGSEIGQGFADGINAKVGAAAAAAAALARAAAGPLEAHSPPKHGPLKHIDRWGDSLVVTWLAPIHRGRGKAERAGRGLADGLGRGMHRGGGSRASGGVHGAAGGRVRHMSVRTLDVQNMRGGRGGGGDLHVHVGTFIGNAAGIDELARRMGRRGRLRDRAHRRYNEPS